MKTVLVTGANGFLGRYCAREFEQAGWQVIGIGLGKWIDETPADYGMAAWFESEVTKEALRLIECKFDAVVHCAGSGSVGFSLTNPYEDFCMTVNTTASVLEYLRAYAPAAHLIYPSSAAVYGCLHDEPIHEDSELCPVSPYGTHKRIAEELCTSYQRNFEVSVSIIRFFSLYGPGLRKQLLWEACHRFSKEGRHEFFGSGEEVRDWLHVRDAAALVRQVAEVPTPAHAINGGSGRNVTVREILGQTASFMGEGIEFSFNGQEREGDPKRLEADISTALGLGWRPTVQLEQGIREYVTWFREEAN